ncbi:FAD-binding oxidoreductase, partial [Candidatus Kaiserbacteria bacterium]|nr:FAD-binding oxidoreductase [Candidatus Kaiserbacteria bacterium]
TQANPKKISEKKLVAKKTLRKKDRTNNSPRSTVAINSIKEPEKIYRTSNTPVLLSVSSQVKRHPLGHLLLEKKLREAGFQGGISTDKKFLDRYSTDESIFCIKPQVVIQPKNKHDLETATKLIASETKRFSSLSLTPRAAGTGLSGGSLTDSIVVDVTTHLTKIDEVKKTKKGVTITCEPGAMWQEVEKKLKKHGFYIPAYPSSKAICTVGGSIANNAAGPDSLRYGHCASWVDSLDVVLADGNTYTIKPLSYKEFKA